MKKKQFFIVLLNFLFLMLMLMPMYSCKSPGNKSNKIKNNLLVALLTDVGGIDDRSFNQATWEGLTKLKEEFNIKEIKYFESKRVNNYIPFLRALSDDGYRLVIVPGYELYDTLTKVSLEYPDTHYLAIDTIIPDRSNVANVIFAEEQGSFLVGVAAAMQAKKEGISKIGFIGGIDSDVIQHFEAGFEQGVAIIDPTITVLVEYAGNFSDLQLGKNISAKFFNQGAKIIFLAAGNVGKGVIEEAKNRARKGEKVWIIGVDNDQYAEGIYKGKKSIILTSMIKRVDVASYGFAKLELEGKFPRGSVTRLTLAHDGVGIPPKNINLSANIKREIEKYTQLIIDGSITVSVLPNRLK